MLRRTGRWRADLPGAFAIVCGIAWVAGLKQDIREALGAYVWGSLVLAVGFGVLWWLGWRALRWEIAADERGVRMTNRAGEVRELGVPRTVRHGQFSAMLTAGHARRNTQHLWLAIETADGTPIVFQRAMGALDRGPTDWPEEMPPVTRETYSSLGFDPAAMLAALGGPRD